MFNWYSFFYGIAGSLFLSVVGFFRLISNLYTGQNELSLRVDSLEMEVKRLDQETDSVIDVIRRDLKEFINKSERNDRETLEALNKLLVEIEKIKTQLQFQNRKE